MYSPVETQDLSENEDEDHSDKDFRLLHVGTNTLFDLLD